MRFADFRTITRARSGEAPFPDREAFERAGAELLAALGPLPMGVRLLGLTLSGMVGEVPMVETARQADLPL